MTDGQTYDPVAATTVDWHKAFSNERRHLTVKFLFEWPSDEPMPVRDLARELEQWLAAHTDAESDYRDIRRGLQTTHLPTLDDADIIVWDDDCIKRGPAFADAVKQLALDTDRS